MATCWYQDSLIIENEFGDTGLTGSYCNIYFRQWSGIIYTSLNDNKVRVISIYPNPSIDGKFIIKNISFQSEFNLYDLLGRNIDLKNIKFDKNNSQVEIDLSCLHFGLYFLQFKNNNQHHVYKLIYQ